MIKKTSKIRKILCAVLTLGNHWWTYAPYFIGNYLPDKYESCSVWCRICGKKPGNQWEIYVKKFKGKKGGKYVTNNNNNS